MKGLNLSDFLRQKFDEGQRLYKDESYRKKKELLVNNNIPFEETDVPNIVKIRMGQKTVHVHLLTAEEDSAEKYIKVRAEGKSEWQDMDIQFFVSRYLSSLQDGDYDVTTWLKINKVFTEEISGVMFVKVKTIGGPELYISKSSDKFGRIPVRFKLDGKDYSYTKERLLAVILGRESPSSGMLKSKNAAMAY